MRFNDYRCLDPEGVRFVVSLIGDASITTDLLEVFIFDRAWFAPAGESEAKVRQLFAEAAAAAPCIVFIGESAWTCLPSPETEALLMLLLY